MSFLIAWYFTGELIFSALAGGFLCLLYYAFRFYNFTNIPSLGAGLILKSLAKNLIIQVFVYGIFYIFKWYDDFIHILYSGLFTLAVPFFSWFVFEFTGSRLARATEIQLE